MIENWACYTKAFLIISVLRDLWELFKNFVLGKKYIVKVNGVWSVCRGHKKHGILRIWYGPDCHKWVLHEQEHREIEKDWDEDRIEREVISQNIQDLKKKHPTDEELDFDYFEYWRRHMMHQRALYIPCPEDE